MSPPRLRSLDYGALLEAQQEAGKEPQLHDIARLVPADQYFLHFNSLKSLGELIDFSDFWGGNLQELFHVRAQDNRVEQKLENQLCLRRQGLSELFADQVIGEIAITGGDPYLLEGTDLSVLLRVENPQLFRQAAMGWLEQVKQKHPGVVSRDFNYRGQKVNAHYTKDRLVSSFVVEKDEYVIYSNSHRGVRRIIDTIAGLSDSLHAASDYRYVTTMLNPSDQNDSGYLFVSEQAIKRLVAPAAKISQKRRRQCFNNLVMLNNASLFYRLEYGRSPETLSELIDKRFVDAGKIVCPHGGAYTWDAARDTCTCSLHNRIKYLTPNCELNVLRVSKAEAEEYARYQQRYAAFWGEVFDPLAIRITVAPRIKFETCVLPFANSGYYGHLRRLVAENPRPIAVGRIAPSAVASFAYVPTREQTAAFLQSVPGVRAILEADPTLTDLAWIGDRVSMHLCDAETILEIDPTQLRA